MLTQTDLDHLHDFQPICPKCGSHEVKTVVIESPCGRYKDEKNICQHCFYDWWVVGIDG